jgi:hypothetical protein
MPVRTIARKLKRTPSSITSRVLKLDLDDPRKWSRAEDAIILANYEANPAIAAMLPHRSWPAIVQRATKTHGLNRQLWFDRRESPVLRSAVE